MVTLKELAQDPELNDFLLDFASALAVEFESEEPQSQHHILHEANQLLTEQKRIALLRYIEMLINQGGYHG